MILDETQRPYHEVADIFPLMQGEEYEALKRDIAQNGQLEAIWLDTDGAIIDGRNRHRACLDLGIEPRFRVWGGESGLVSFVVSLNLNRRHLTSSQRAAVALDVLERLEKEARERQRLGAIAQRNGIEVTELIPDPQMGESRDQAATLFDTNPRYISDAKKLSREAPDLFEAVKAGEMTIPAAKREYVKATKKPAPPLPSDKYRVLLADPPWSYGNSGVIGDSDHYSRTARHYPSMTIEELCELDVRDLCEPNAVLFLWVTSPLLEECFPVIKAWGFKYKTSFVWDKVGHNYGHYNSVRHEFLLVCTRGSCTPDAPDLIGSVQSIQKSKKHSEKPEEFRRIIDHLYPHGRRLELFARTTTEGWDVWGNEC